MHGLQPRMRLTLQNEAASFRPRGKARFELRARASGFQRSLIRNRPHDAAPLPGPHMRGTEQDIR